MKTSIQYKNRAPEQSDGFYHADCPVLFGQHDEITRLEDCPFPLETSGPTGFKVLLFGVSKVKPGDTFAVVEYRKSCGHLVQERITFCEGVQDFDHYGDKFIGADYSINNWERRIESFRTILPCEVCQMAEKTIWLYASGLSDGGNSRKRAMDSLRRLLDYNYANWTQFVDIENIRARLAATPYGSR